MALFTSSLTAAYEMSEGLQAGAVAINAGTNDWELGGPFGGYRKAESAASSETMRCAPSPTSRPSASPCCDRCASGLTLSALAGGYRS